MDTPFDPHRHLFLVRLWLESSCSEGGQKLPGTDGCAEHSLNHDQWRGLVENVTTGQRLYFTSLADMSDFISFQVEKK